MCGWLAWQHGWLINGFSHCILTLFLQLNQFAIKGYSVVSEKPFARKTIYTLPVITVYPLLVLPIILQTLNSQVLSSHICGHLPLDECDPTTSFFAESSAVQEEDPKDPPERGFLKSLHQHQQL